MCPWLKRLRISLLLNGDGRSRQTYRGPTTERTTQGVGSLQIGNDRPLEW
jgi:hypothetical protein